MQDKSLLIDHVQLVLVTRVLVPTLSLSQGKSMTAHAEELEKSYFALAGFIAQEVGLGVKWRVTMIIQPICMIKIWWPADASHISKTPMIVELDMSS